MSLQDELNDRYERLLATDAQIIDHQVVLVRDWINRRPELRAVLAEAGQTEPDVDSEAWLRSLTDSEEFRWSPSRTEPGRAWLVWKLMNHIADCEQAGAIYQVRGYGKLFTDWVTPKLGVKAQNNHQVQAFVPQVFGPFFHYLIDQVSLGGSVVHTLRRYKTRVEWFHDRDDLYRRYQQAVSGDGDEGGEKKSVAEDPGKGAPKRKVGEDVYDLDLQRFLFLDAGYNIFAKARASSGEPDLVGELDSSDPLICEGKLFTGDKAHLGKGVGQVLLAAQHYNKTVAYLVVFNLTSQQLNIHTDGPAGAWAPYVELAGVRVNIIVVRALPPERTDSKVGKPRPATISRHDLVVAVPVGDVTSSPAVPQ
jgi:hypothetical protein